MTSKATNQKKSSKSGADIDIIDLILRDHEPIKKLILILKDSEESISKKKPAYTEFVQVLTNHAKAEEKSLYVHMKKEKELRIPGLEGDIEHALADQLVMEINQIKNDDDSWIAKVKVLAELVDHHVKEEETKMLKEVRKEMDSEARMEIGEEYTLLLSELQAQKTKLGGKMKPSVQDERRANHA